MSTCYWQYVPKAELLQYVVHIILAVFVTEMPVLVPQLLDPLDYAQVETAKRIKRVAIRFNHTSSRIIQRLGDLLRSFSFAEAFFTARRYA